MGQGVGQACNALVTDFSENAMSYRPFMVMGGKSTNLHGNVHVFVLSC